MTKVVQLRPRHPLVGTWFHPSGDSSAEFTITLEDGRFMVSGIDTGDNELFEITGVSWNGEELSFIAAMPSTSWRTRHVFRLLDDVQVEHECTTYEVWQKR